MHDLLHSLTGISKSLPEHFAKDRIASNPEAETDFQSLLSKAGIAAVSGPAASSESQGGATIAIEDLVSALIDLPIASDDHTNGEPRGDIPAVIWPENASDQATTEVTPFILERDDFSAATSISGKPPERDIPLKGIHDQKPTSEHESVEQLSAQTPQTTKTVEVANATTVESATPRLAANTIAENSRRHTDVQGLAKIASQNGTASQHSTVGMVFSDSVVGVANSEAPEGDEIEKALASSSAKNLVAGDKVAAEAPKAQLVFHGVRQPLNNLDKNASDSVDLRGSQEELLIEGLPGITSNTGHSSTGTIQAATAPTGIAQTTVQQITFALQNMKDGSIELQLNPEELGRVKLNLDNSEGQMKISIIAERAETADLLRRNLDQLSAELMTAGLEGVVISFGENTADSGEQPQQSTSHSEQNPEQPIQSTFIHGPIAISEGVDLRI